MGSKTNAVRLIQQAGIPCREAWYDFDENDLSDYETELVLYRDIFDMEDPENDYRYLFGNAGGELKIISYLKFYFKYVIEKLF